jgi:RHS repeat-associated protein
MERDEESGFSYHTARYYASWLGRWTSPDPAGLVEGPSLFVYVAAHPTQLIDPRGMQGSQTSKRTEKRDVAEPNAKILEESGIKYAEEVTLKTRNEAGATVTLRADKLAKVGGEYFYIEEKLPEKVLTVEGNIRAKAFTKNQLKKGGLKAVFNGTELEIRGGKKLGEIDLKIGSKIQAKLHVVTENEFRVVKNVTKIIEFGKEVASSITTPETSKPTVSTAPTEPAAPETTQSRSQEHTTDTEPGSHPAKLPGRPGLIELDPKPSGQVFWGITVIQGLHDLAPSMHATRDYETWPQTLSRGPIPTAARLGYEAWEGAKMTPGLLWRAAAALLHSDNVDAEIHYYESLPPGSQ